jgi:hypothetical protein
MKRGKYIRILAKKKKKKGYKNWFVFGRKDIRFPRKKIIKKWTH